MPGLRTTWLARHEWRTPARTKWLTWLEGPPVFVVLLPPRCKRSDPCLESGENILEFSFLFSLGVVATILSFCTTEICARQR